MQAFVGLAEASAGGLVTLGSGGLAAPIGLPVLVHGLDQFVTGLGTTITGRHRITLTEQLLQTTGMSPEWASLTNDALSIAGTMGGAAIFRASQLAVFRNYKLHNPISRNEVSLTPEKFFQKKTYTEMEQILTKKFGPPRGGGLHNKSFYNARTNRTFNLHKDPTHRAGKPHVDIRKRGLPTNYYKDNPFFLKEEL